MNVQAKLTIGPSHLWIRHLDEEGKWVNVELTSGQLPSDGLMMTELGINREAIKSGAYFKPLTERESIAFLLTQLAYSYQRKFGEYNGFTEKCADLSIEIYNANVMAYMLKSNKLAIDGQNEIAQKKPDEEKLEQIHKRYVSIQEKLKIFGATIIKAEDYNSWVNSMKSRKQKIK